MSKTYILPEKSRTKMQQAWGMPLFGNESQVSGQFQTLIKGKPPKLIITVGDHCSSRLKSDIKIFDGFVQRKQVDKPHRHTLSVKNPAATIQKNAWDVVREAIARKENVCVDGEEDLLVIPAVLLAPQKTLVVYGFPGRGVCAIEANAKNKAAVRQALRDLFQPAVDA